MYLVKAFFVWLVLMAAESIHGVLRTLILTPHVGDFRARQISVFTGSLIILAIAYLFIKWIGAKTTGALIAVGLAWLLLMLLFEISLGRLVFDYSWERLLSDYNIFTGGLLSIGMVVLALSPLMVAKLRGVI